MMYTWYMSGQMAQNLNWGIEIHILGIEMHTVCLEIKTLAIDIYT